MNAIHLQFNYTLSLEKGATIEKRQQKIFVKEKYEVTEVFVETISK